jgi:transposase
MDKAREILRQKWLLGRTHRQIAQSTGVSTGSVSNVLEAASEGGLLDYAAVEALSEEGLDRRLNGAPVIEASSARAEPDCAWIHRERHRKGVTLALLHAEYLQQHPDGYRYTAFCDRYRVWLGRQGLVMRQHHAGGEKMFVDYAGMRPHVVDRETGEVTAVELFVAVLGASNYTYAEATRTQRGPDWIGAHVRALEYFGGVPVATVCDQLKSGVSRACRYEPEVQRTYEDMARHYGTTVLPARPKSPRDKAKVEQGVLLAERWILARLRNEVFHTLSELNERIGELLEELNARTMRRYKKSRRELFEAVERPALSALPASRFEYCEWKKARVNIDYHVVFADHFYSVPYSLVHQEVWIRATARTVEVLLRGRRVALHARSNRVGGHTTLPEHMPSSHRAHAEWTPSRILDWAQKTGNATHDLCAAILGERRHPEQGFRSCLGILRLEKRYGRDRLERACARASKHGARSYRSVESILKKGLDQVAPPSTEPGSAAATIGTHENVRGPSYFH